MSFNNDLYYTTDRAKISIDVMKFPGGEVGVNVNQPGNTPLREFNGSITAHIRNSDDLMALILATDALKRAYPGATWTLVLPYIPYARQDRVCNAGEALSVRVFADLINAQGYASVVIFDAHSPVSVACLDRAYNIEQFDIFAPRHPSLWNNVTIVAPDQGATKKCEAFAKRVNAKAVVTCHKTRELSTGKITGMSFVGSPDLDHERLVVLDDICDGGRTFIELANLIKESCVSQPSRLELMVTHGIFSRGVDIVAAHYDMIYTTDSYYNQDHPKVKVIKL